MEPDVPSTARNPGQALDEAWVRRVTVERHALDRQVAELVARRPLKGPVRAAWLLKALTCVDLTTLAGDDTPGRVRRLCGKARQPLRPELVAALGVSPSQVRVAAVCIYHRYIATALEALQGSAIPVAAVSTGFPAGLTPFDLKLREVEASVAAGAAEIDVVLTREHVLLGNWRAVYDEVHAYRAACGDAHLKVILGTGDIRVLQNVGRAALASMMAGADFVKTSTGKESINATLPVALVMLRAIRDYAGHTGYRVGFKPAGGVSTASQALAYLVLVQETLGRRWLEPDLFRFGASSLLGNLERELDWEVLGHRSNAACYALG